MKIKKNNLIQIVIIVFMISVFFGCSGGGIDAGNETEFEIDSWARSTTSGTSQTTYFYDSAIDSQGNIYAVGYQTPGGKIGYGQDVATNATYSGNNAIMVKFNQDGNALWAKAVSGSLSNNFTSIAIDSNDNIYVVGSVAGNGAFNYGGSVTSARGISPSNNNGILLKYNSEGVAQWARLATASTYSTKSNEYKDVAVDKSDNVYVVGYQFNASYTYGSISVTSGSDTWQSPLLMKYKSNGDIIWAKSSETGSATASFTAAAVDSNGNIYVVGIQTNNKVIYRTSSEVSATGAHTINNAVLVKYNSGGVAQWARTATITGDADQSWFDDITVDSSNNIYVAGRQRGSGSFKYSSGAKGVSGGYSDGYNAVLIKYNSSGSVQWARTTKTAATSWFQGIAIDSGNIYVGGYHNGKAAYTFCGSSDANNKATQRGGHTGSNSVLAMYNSSGNPQWVQSAITSVNASEFKTVAARRGSVYGVGYQSGNSSVSYSISDAEEVSTSGASSSANAVIVRFR